MVMTQTAFRLGDAQIEKLSRLAAESGLDRAEIIRRLIDEADEAGPSLTTFRRELEAAAAVLEAEARRIKRLRKRLGK